MTFSEKQVAEIVQRILTNLESKVDKPEALKCLALFTGGVIGLEEVLVGLKEISQAGVEVVSLLSSSAEQVITKEKIATALGETSIFTEKNPGPVAAILQDVRLVLVPVLTINTAAKVALGIADNIITTVFRNAILLRKELIVVKNACTLDDPVRIQLGHNRCPVAYNQMVQSYLDRLASFGCKVIGASELSRTVKGILSLSPASSRLDFRGKRLVTYEDIINLYDVGKDVLIQKGTLITPLARETANNMGIEFVIED